MKNAKSRKKAQMFLIELGIAILLFMSAITLYYRYVSGIESNDADNLEDLIGSGKDISGSLISSGYPSGWNAGNVERIGLTDKDNRINETKLERFSNISYETTKFLLSTPYEYYVFFRDRNGNVVGIVNNTLKGIGRPGVNSTNISKREDVRSIVKVERLIIMNSDIVRMVIYVWSI